MITSKDLDKILNKIAKLDPKCNDTNLSEIFNMIVYLKRKIK